jgi:hypothetical protein
VKLDRLPVLDLFIGRDGDGWRLFLSPASWAPALIATRMDERREVYPVRQPHADDLARFMSQTAAPYHHRCTPDGGIKIVATGRSALCLLVWLVGIVGSAPPKRDG